MTLRLRLVLWYAAVLAASGLALVAGLYLLVAHRARSELDRLLDEEHTEWVAVTRELGGDLPALEKEIAAELAESTYMPYWYRLSETGTSRTLLFAAAPRVKERYARELALLAPPPPGEAAVRTVRIGESGRRYRVRTGTLRAGDGTSWTVQVGMDTRRMDGHLRTLERNLLLVVLAVLAAATAGGRLVAGRALRSIEEVTRDLERVQAASLAERLPVERHRDEVGRLRDALNRMLGRLEASFGRMQVFTAAAAHDLRGPLSALQVRIEAALNRRDVPPEEQELLADLLERTGALTRLVDGLLLLARIDATDRPRDLQPVALDAVLSEVAEPFVEAGETREVVVVLRCDDSVVAEGDPHLLRVAFANLVDNAVRHSRPGESVRVCCSRAGEECLVTVADDGPGIPEEARQHVFERFWRGDPARAGEGRSAGLGLSIVKAAVELHGGGVELASEVGKGTEVRIRLPARQPPRP